jgi:drug/metabolite transporter (DMT)-like permease
VNGRVALAVLVAVVTAFLYAMSNVLELIEAEKIPDEHALKLSLMSRLIRQPRWIAGFVCDVFGFLGQALALSLAAVIFVEPILASGILMALLIGALITHRTVEPRDWLAAGLLAAGLALFLYEVSPTAGTSTASTGRWIVAIPILGAVIGALIFFAMRHHGPPRAALLAVAAGVLFGVSAIFTKALTHYLASGLFAWVPHWEPYGLAVTAIGGVVIAQSSLQTGALAASVAPVEAMGPITAAALGFGLLNERFTSVDAVGMVAVAIAVAAMLWGIIQLAHAEGRLIGHANVIAGAEPDASSLDIASTPCKFTAD